ncbi:MAG: glycosylase [Rhodospirillales bacterium]|nr:glycosylase [Rhodospirillales bacterium]
MSAATKKKAGSSDDLLLADLPEIARGLETLSKSDPRFADLRPRLKLRRKRDGFAGLVRIILGQQVSTLAADAMWTKLLAASADRVEPRVVATLDDETLAGCGFSRQKVRYVRALAAAIGDGTLDLAQVDRADDETAIEMLTHLPGFGRWSAEIYLMFCLGRGDVWPAGDLGIVLGLETWHGLKSRPTPVAARSLGDAWKPHRTAAALFLWQHYTENAIAQRAAKKAVQKPASKSSATTAKPTAPNAAARKR